MPGTRDRGAGVTDTGLDAGLSAAEIGIDGQPSTREGQLFDALRTS